jgi:hypothetical protein
MLDTSALEPRTSPSATLSRNYFKSVTEQEHDAVSVTAASIKVKHYYMQNGA